MLRTARRIARRSGHRWHARQLAAVDACASGQWIIRASIANSSVSLHIGVRRYVELFAGRCRELKKSPTFSRRLRPPVPSCDASRRTALAHLFMLIERTRRPSWPRIGGYSLRFGHAEDLVDRRNPFQDLADAVVVKRCHAALYGCLADVLGRGALEGQLADLRASSSSARRCPAGRGSRSCRSGCSPCPS